MKKQIHTIALTILLLFGSLKASESIYKNRGNIITADHQVVAHVKDGKREFPHANSLEPLLGYVDENLTGKIALEKHLNPIFAKGNNVQLTIDLSLQKKIEETLDRYKEKLQADEILAAVMDSTSGKILAMVSSNRYNPGKIRKKDIAAIVPKFAAYPYEAGAVIKPLSIAVAMEHLLVTPEKWFNTHNGRLDIGKGHWITDDDKFAAMTVTDIVVHSSNVGTSLISWMLDGQQFREGLLKFGLAPPSGIDLTRDLPGSLKKVQLLQNKLHRANTSYGYGLTVTFAQLFKAYSAFNNNGVAVIPRLVDYLEDAKGNHYTREPKVGDLHPISKNTVEQMHNILLEVVKRGTGVKAQYPGLEIGGKTGTAYMVKNGHYVKEYHSSFYGFANDKKGDKYTIGVLVIRPKAPNSYFASRSAVPVFREVVDTMVKEKYLLFKQRKNGSPTVLHPSFPK